VTLTAYEFLRVLLHFTGTDATHAEHIETIKQRLYVGLTPDSKFIPGELGIGLVEGEPLE
jgi:DNA topoisomerase-3